jgi:hypothetical protein
MKISLSKKDPSSNAKRLELENALQNLSTHFFTPASGTIEPIYSSTVMYSNYLPAWHPAHLFAISRRTLIYPIAYRMASDAYKNFKELCIGDYAPTPYVWVTRTKRLVIKSGDRHYFVNPRNIRYCMYEALIDRLILSLKGDKQALAAIYADEVLTNIHGRTFKIE